MIPTNFWSIFPIPRPSSLEMFVKIRKKGRNSCGILTAIFFLYTTLRHYHKCFGARALKWTNFEQILMTKKVSSRQWLAPVGFAILKHAFNTNPGFGPDPNWAMIRPNRAHTPVFPERNYRVWKAVRAHNSLDHGLISVWSEVNSVWTVWS